MIYDVSKLRKATEKAIAAHDAASKESHQKKESEYLKRLTDWREKHNAAWATAARKIAAKARKGQPIGPEDLPRDRYDRTVYFDARNPGDYRHSVPEDFRVVSAALDLITDDTITPTELSKLGVRAPQLRAVLASVPRDREA